jgi:hypothetical protein
MRQEIEAAGGMQEWALEQYTHGKPKGLRPSYNPLIVRSMNALRTSCFLHEKGVVSMGAATTMQYLLPRLKRANTHEVLACRRATLGRSRQ